MVLDKLRNFWPRSQATSQQEDTCPLIARHFQSIINCTPTSIFTMRVVALLAVLAGCAVAEVYFEEKFGGELPLQSAVRWDPFLLCCVFSAIIVKRNSF